MTDPDITPPHGTEIPTAEDQARSDRAQVRPGVHVAPPAAMADWATLIGEVTDDIDRAIQQARAILRIARRPWQDPSWPVIRDKLKLAEMRLSGHPEDDHISAVKLDIVRQLIRGQRA